MDASSRSESPDQHPWYAEGLRFSCTQCGRCCGGSPGFVWVNEQERAALADHLELSADEFERLYLRKIGARYSLKEFPNGDCVFLDEETRRCGVYEVRPLQCRTWPFWDSNVQSPETWEETCRECPGAGQGKLYQLGEIEKRRSALRI